MPFFPSLSPFYFWGWEAIGLTTSHLHMQLDPFASNPNSFLLTIYGLQPTYAHSLHNLQKFCLLSVHVKILPFICSLVKILLSMQTGKIWMLSILLYFFVCSLFLTVMFKALKEDWICELYKWAALCDGFVSSYKIFLSCCVHSWKVWI